MNKQQLRELASLAAACKPVTVIPEGVSAGISDKEWHTRLREPRSCYIDRRVEERRVVGTDHMGRSIIENGLGERIAVE